VLCSVWKGMLSTSIIIGRTVVHCTVLCCAVLRRVVVHCTVLKCGLM
jgi:hypothetical protein